jgi:hypothetical protein
MPPYLVLLRAGFCLPPMLPPARCALTAPFHHCLRQRPAKAGRYQVGCVFSVPLSFELPRPGVTRRTALRSSDFPLTIAPYSATENDDHSSSLAIAGEIKQPTRKYRMGHPCPPSPACASHGETTPLFGLAPCGVLPATRVTTGAVRSYRTFSPLLEPRPRKGRATDVGRPFEGRHRAVCFLCHFPSGHPDRALPGALPSGVRTFLPPSRSTLRWASSLIEACLRSREAAKEGGIFSVPLSFRSP